LRGGDHRWRERAFAFERGSGTLARRCALHCCFNCCTAQIVSSVRCRSVVGRISNVMARARQIPALLACTKILRAAALRVAMNALEFTCQKSRAMRACRARECCCVDLPDPPLRYRKKKS
jgi:hypothetical protein